MEELKSPKIIILLLIILLLSIVTITLIVQNNQLTTLVDDKRTELKGKDKEIEELKEDLYYYEYISDSSYSNILTVKLDKVRKMIEEKETFVLLISQTYCSHCIAFKPLYNQVLKDNKIIGYDLDLVTLSESDRLKFNELFEVTQTPTTLVFVNGEEQAEKIVGVPIEKDLTEFLKKYSIIK